MTGDVIFVIFSVIYLILCAATGAYSYEKTGSAVSGIICFILAPVVWFLWVFTKVWDAIMETIE